MNLKYLDLTTIYMLPNGVLGDVLNPFWVIVRKIPISLLTALAMAWLSFGTSASSAEKPFVEFDFEQPPAGNQPGIWQTSTNGAIRKSVFHLRSMLLIPVPLPYNRLQDIEKNLLDPSFTRLVGRMGRLSERDLQGVSIARDSTTHKVRLTEIGDDNDTFCVMSNLLTLYFRERTSGHSHECLLEGIKNQTNGQQELDPFVAAILSKEPMLPGSGFVTDESGYQTNYAGSERTSGTLITDAGGSMITNHYVELYASNEIWRWRNMHLVDAEVSWSYHVELSDSGRKPVIIVGKSDAKDVDPKYAKIMREVDQQIQLEYSRNGIGPRGIRYQNLKKQLLKNRGIKWRTTEELNPEQMHPSGVR